MINDYEKSNNNIMATTMSSNTDKMAVVRAATFRNETNNKQQWSVVDGRRNRDNAQLQAY